MACQNASFVLCHSKRHRMGALRPEKNMSTLLKPLVFIMLSLLIACAGPKVSQDYNEDTEFDPGWGRYEWRGGTSQIDGVSHSRLQRITEQAMVQRGYRLDPDNPQFYVSVSGTTRAAVGGGKSVGISIG